MLLLAPFGRSAAIITCSQSKSALKKDIASAHLPGETEGVVLDPE